MLCNEADLRSIALGSELNIPCIHVGGCTTEGPGLLCLGGDRVLTDGQPETDRRRFVCGGAPCSIYLSTILASRTRSRNRRGILKGNNHSTKALLHLTGPYVGIQNSRSRRLKSVEVHKNQGK